MIGIQPPAVYKFQVFPIFLIFKGPRWSYMQYAFCGLLPNPPEIVQEHGWQQYLSSGKFRWIEKNPNMATPMSIFREHAISGTTRELIEMSNKMFAIASFDYP